MQSHLGVMVSATCALYDMEMNFEHAPVDGRSNCLSAKWTDASRALIQWIESDTDRLDFQVTIALPDTMSQGNRTHFFDGVTGAASTAACPLWRSAALIESGIVVNLGAVIDDSTYVDAVADVYMQAFTEASMIETAIWLFSEGDVDPVAVGEYLDQSRGYTPASE